MAEHKRTNLSSIGDFASVQTCSCCNDEVLHVNFYNMTIRLTKEYFRAYTSMLNEAMLRIDDTGEFKEELQGIYHFYSFLGNNESVDNAGDKDTL